MKKKRTGRDEMDAYMREPLKDTEVALEVEEQKQRLETVIADNFGLPGEASAQELPDYFPHVIHYPGRAQWRHVAKDVDVLQMKREAADEFHVRVAERRVARCKEVFENGKVKARP